MVGPVQWGLVNKFKQVSSDGHQMSLEGVLPGVPTCHVWKGAGLGLELGGHLQRGLMHHGQWSHGNPRGQTHMIELLPRNFVGGGNKQPIYLSKNNTAQLYFLLRTGGGSDIPRFSNRLRAFASSHAGNL